MSEQDETRLTGEAFDLSRFLHKGRTVGLLRLDDDWFHVSHRDLTVKIRPIVQDPTNDDDGIDEDRTRTWKLDDENDRAQLSSTLGPGTFYAGWSLKYAIDGRDTIVRGLALASGVAAPKVVPQRDRIPQTRLRHFYRSLRDFGDREVWFALLDNALRKKGRELEFMFTEAYRHLLYYDNSGEHFGDAHRSVRESQSDGEGFAFRIVNELAQKRTWRGISGLECSFVTREMSPLRTTRALFDDFRSARSSGAGGVDVLLRADEGGLPIIGEVKARNDTNLFMALVQSLTYASELITPAQRRRLALHHGFGSDWAANDVAPHADVYIIYEDGTDPEIERGTIQLAEYLMTRGREISRRLRRIAFLSCEEGDGIDALRLARLVSHT